MVLHGVTGSGTSVLWRRLAALTGAPYVSVDDLMWRPGWVQLRADEQVEAIRPWWAGDPQIRVLRLSSPREAEAWLRRLQGVHAAA